MRILSPYEQNAVELAIAEAATAQSIAAERARLFDKQQKRITKAEAATQPRLKNLSHFVKEEQRERRRVQHTEQPPPSDSHAASTADVERMLGEAAPKQTTSLMSWSSMSWWGWPADEEASNNGSATLFDRESRRVGLHYEDSNAAADQDLTITRAQQRSGRRRGRSNGAGEYHPAHPTAHELRERARDRFFAPSPRAYFSKLTPRASSASSTAPSPRSSYGYAADTSPWAGSMSSSCPRGIGPIRMPPPLLTHQCACSSALAHLSFVSRSRVDVLVDSTMLMPHSCSLNWLLPLLMSMPMCRCHVGCGWWRTSSNVWPCGRWPSTNGRA